MPHPLLDPTSDFVFKILLVKNPDLLRDMIEAVLVPEVPIRELRILNPDIPKDFPGDKAIVLDVRVRLGDGSQIDLEMQSTVLDETPGRFLYYWARDFVDTMRAGDSYADLCPCVSSLAMSSQSSPWRRRNARLGLSGGPASSGPNPPPNSKDSPPMTLS